MIEPSTEIVLACFAAIAHLYWRSIQCERRESKREHRLEKLEQENFANKLSLAAIESGSYILSCVIAASMPGQTIIRVSDGASQILGYAPQDLVGKPVETVIPEEFREQHNDAIGKATELGRINRGTLAVDAFALHRDGTKIPVRVTLHESSKEPWEVEAQIDRRRV